MTNRLRNAKIAIFGLGCIGSYTGEILAKNGAGVLELIDAGKVGLSRDGCYKTAKGSGTFQFRVELEQHRLRRLYPDTEVKVRPVWFTEETKGQFDFSTYDYVLDALDGLETKTLLAACAIKNQVPLVSCLDIKNCFNPAEIRLMPVCEAPEAFVPASWRALCETNGITGNWKVVCSSEYEKSAFKMQTAIPCLDCACPSSVALVCEKRRVEKSSCNVFVSAMAGMLAGEEILMYLTHREDGR